MTGASSGLGRAVSLNAALYGAKVVLIARDSERLRLVREALPGEGHSWFSFDLQHVDAIPVLLSNVVATAGRPRALVHCAGICIQQPLRFIDQDSLQKTMRVNVESAFFLTQAIRHKQIRGERMSIVLVASVAAMLGSSSLATYCASKGALVAGMKAMAEELARDKIRINCVAPGCFQSDMLQQLGGSVGGKHLESLQAKHPLGLGTPDDVSHACLFLISHLSSWITGSTLVVDGGYSACK
ncbi:SDR family oxidoreductase [Desulfovibrio aerotolerans]|uniref:SDR family oxidoreductase n=1 Tax=Solidesulfovibrio aerotolerans TaxID=295255 RepID=A0A7C9NLA6_9BACT|nr:SDR family oxidoreductase [Solidesulfovibrio aerotolerans]